MYVFFADMRAIFDKIDRTELWKDLRKKDIKKKIVDNIETNKVCIDKQRTEWRSATNTWKRFIHGKRSKAGMSAKLAPLYTVYIGSERTHEKKAGRKCQYRKNEILHAGICKWSRSSCRNRRGNGNNVRLGKLYTFTQKKKIELNVDKSKILIFRKRRRRKKRIRWRWENQEIEEVREFKYLGYTFSANNSDKGHIQDVCRRTIAAIVQVWDIEKFGGDFKRRMVMFNVLVKSILMYAVKIWGLKERKEIEAL